MNLSNLSQIVDTYIPINSGNLDNYYNQLRQELIPYIRELQKRDLLNWFSFLIHGPKELNKREPIDNKLYIHIRLEPNNCIDINDFIKELPKHFLNPIQVTLSNIAEINSSLLQNKENWEYSWKILEISSEWVLSLIENHKNTISIKQITQFLHFITNPLHLGYQCNLGEHIF